MERKEFFDAIDLEVQWLKYYALADSRAKLDLNNNVSIYDQLTSIGYTKRVIPLDKRCAFLRVTSNNPITKDTPISELIPINEYRDNSKNIFTALEYYILTEYKPVFEIYLMLQ